MTNLKIQKKYTSGFTLVETLIAVLILTISIGALLSLAAGGFFSVKYARNQIVANNLMQESIEYIRNTRDSALLQGLSFEDWKTNILSVDVNGNPTGSESNGCLSQNGCYVDPYANNFKIKECPPDICPAVLYYPDNYFYGYNNQYPFSIGTNPYTTTFVRKITITTPDSGDPDQLIMTASISWLNGSNIRTDTQKVLFTNWTP